MMTMILAGPGALGPALAVGAARATGSGSHGSRAGSRALDPLARVVAGGLLEKSKTGWKKVPG